MGLGGASRDDTNDFFVVFLIKSMNDQQYRTRPYGSDRYPTFLILESDVTLRNRVEIVENENGSLKANIVLAKILAVLVLIPQINSRRGLPASAGRGSRARRAPFSL